MAGACAETDPILGVGSSWGVPTDDEQQWMIPEKNRAEGVLEIFLMGGLCPWDTFYVVPDFGKDTKTMWWTFQEGPDNIPERFAGCGGSGDLITPFGSDSQGRQVFLGPWLYPLRARQDILNRMRIFVMRHPFEPHQAATPIMMGGAAPTSTFSAMGAHVQRHYRELEPDRRTPHAYTIYSGDTEIAAQFDIHSASASGDHPAWARPLVVKLVPDNPLSSQLARAHLGGRTAETDALIRRYMQRYSSSLTIPGFGSPMQCRAFGEYEISRDAMLTSPELTSLLTKDLLAARAGQECGDSTDLDTTAMGIALGTHLLTAPAEERARYVTYLDSGLINATGAGYDTHDLHVAESSRNVVHMAKTLANAINKPGEGDPKKLDLDKHTILLTTEFGRTIKPEAGKPQGLNHHPEGFVVVAIGGFVDEERAGVTGAIAETGEATTHLAAPEFRAGMLMGQGIWPFTNESFAVGGIRTASTRPEAARFVRQNVLGYRS